MEKDLQRLKSEIEEYQVVVSESTDGSLDGLAGRLAVNHDWTLDGANELIDLAKQYGSFMLSNALALSIALGIEDGGKGF